MLRRRHHSRARRDPETEKSLEEIYRKTDFSGGIINFNKEVADNASVLADGLAENRYASLAKDIRAFIKRVAIWRKKLADRGIPEYAWWKAEHGLKPVAWGDWIKIERRIRNALRQIGKQNKTDLTWERRRPHKALITIKGYNTPTLHKGPFPISVADIEDLESIRAWLKKTIGLNIGRAIRSDVNHLGDKYERRLELVGKDDVVIRAQGGKTVIIEVGRTRPHAKGRTVAHIADVLKQNRFVNPNANARRLYRMGIVLTEDKQGSTNLGMVVVNPRRYGLRKVGE